MAAPGKKVVGAPRAGKKGAPEIPELRVVSQAKWEAWLRQHHASARGVWLLLAKKGAARRSPSYAEAVEVALCFGWIDGQKRARDAREWAQRFTPRGPASLWSKINVRKAEELIAAGKMRPAGLAAIEAAKRDGRWARAYSPARSMEVPGDLAEALEAHPACGKFFAGLSGANRYAILFRLETAKTPETRARRLALCLAMLARGETFH